MNRIMSRSRIPNGLAKRNGTILGMVLVALLVVSLITGALIQAIVNHHRQSKRAEQRQQAEWLAEAAIQRTIRNLAITRDYSGDTWQIPADVFAGGQHQVATIRVESAPDVPNRRVIHVTVLDAERDVQLVLYQFQRSIELTNPGGPS